MRSVTFMLLVLGVLPDEPASFPISRRFASAFAISTLLTSRSDEAGHLFISAFVSDHSDKLQSVVLHLQDADGDAIGMPGPTSFLFRFLEFFIAVAKANQTPSGYLQKDIFCFLASLGRRLALQECTHCCAV